MNHRTELDIALLGYAIQIEREAQYKKPGETCSQMNQLKRHQKLISEVLQENVELSNLKTKK